MKTTLKGTLAVSLLLPLFGFQCSTDPHVIIGNDDGGRGGGVGGSPDGGTGSGGTGSGGTGSGGAGSACPTPEEYSPGLCDPTYAAQVARPINQSCNAGSKVYTGDCGGYRVWTLTHSSQGDWSWCLYDGQGTLVGERVCTDAPLACGSTCLTSGVTPSPYPAYPSPSSCPVGALTSFCDAAGTGGSTGSGGSVAGTGGAGTGGVSGTGGAANTPLLTLPDCVTNLMAACPPQGACTSASPDDKSYNVCFASGVRATLSQVPNASACVPGLASVMTVTKIDGSVCYSVESYADNGMQCEGGRYIWRDAAGVQIATGIVNPYFNPTTKVTCTTGGTSASCHAPLGSNIPCCGITSLGRSLCSDEQCVNGACP